MNDYFFPIWIVQIKTCLTLAKKMLDFFILILLPLQICKYLLTNFGTKFYFFNEIEVNDCKFVFINARKGMFVHSKSKLC